MENLENSLTCWRVCQNCKGQGKKKQRQSKKSLIQQAINEFKNELISCKKCLGSGLITSKDFPQIDNENYPHLAIIGAGIGGVALAVACLHRGIPFTLYERDKSFNDRKQGYGLTLQQASKAIKGLGITALTEGIVSTKHIVHNTNGTVIGEWGMRKWLPSEVKKAPKKSNIHIARQSLRLALLNQLSNKIQIQWNHQLVDITENKDQTVCLNFKVNEKKLENKADLVIGADGIRSLTRTLILQKQNTPLRYLHCIVILGICELEAIKNVNSDLLDSETVFQTGNGNERIYMMPYSKNEIMWQLSFPLAEKEAKDLSSKGAKYLKEEACRRTQWHSPIPEILAATLETKISGYPVYDRELLTPEKLSKSKNVTLIGDAAHPMSPFKGQGANQALLDALLLAREISKKSSNWKEIGIRQSVLNNFENEMLTRSAIKVKDSAEAALFLHTEVMLQKNNEPRGSIVKRKK